MNIKVFTRISYKRRTIDRLKKKLAKHKNTLRSRWWRNGAQGYVREVLEVVLERVGELQRKAELLRSKIDFLRNRLNAKVEGFKQSEEFWNQRRRK